jgi:hypothetical protein
VHAPRTAPWYDHNFTVDWGLSGELIYYQVGTGPSPIGLNASVTKGTPPSSFAKCSLVVAHTSRRSIPRVGTLDLRLAEERD